MSSVQSCSTGTVSTKLIAILLKTKSLVWGTHKWKKETQQSMLSLIRLVIQKLANSWVEWLISRVAQAFLSIFENRRELLFVVLRQNISVCVLVPRRQPGPGGWYVILVWSQKWNIQPRYWQIIREVWDLWITGRWVDVPNTSTLDIATPETRFTIHISNFGIISRKIW